MCFLFLKHQHQETHCVSNVLVKKKYEHICFYNLVGTGLCKHACVSYCLTIFGFWVSLCSAVFWVLTVSLFASDGSESCGDGYWELSPCSEGLDSRLCAGRHRGRLTSKLPKLPKHWPKEGTLEGILTKTTEALRNFQFRGPKMMKLWSELHAPTIPTWIRNGPEDFVHCLIWAEKRHLEWIHNKFNFMKSTDPKRYK